jgi:hypothetical protein
MKRLWLVPLFALGCSDDPGVNLRWAFGESRMSCDEAGVATVHVFVGPLTPSGSYDREIRCTAGEWPGVPLLGIAPGRHVLVVKGLARDHVRFFLEREVNVRFGDDLGTIVVPAATP